MQKTLVSLILLNVGLTIAVTVAMAHRRPVVVPTTAAEPHSERTFQERAVAAARNAAQANKASPQSVWESLVSTDLHKYAENLRRAGCPEQTIKDIMLAEINRAYSPKERALKVRADDISPWEKLGVYDRRAGEGKLRALLEEKRTLLKELTGVDIGIDMPTRLAGRDVEKFETAFGAVPGDKRDQVRAVQENYWAQSDDIKQRTLGYLEPEDRDEFLRLKTERKDALAKVLGPRELQDYEMKTSDTGTALKSRMQGFQATDDETRKIFDYMQPLDDKFSLGRRNPDPVDTDFTAARTQAEKDLTDYIHSVLGDDRFAEYERTRDPAYRTINQIGTEAGLPKESILQAYQTQQQIQADSSRIMQDPQLTPEQRAQSLDALRNDAQAKLQQLFGDKSAQILNQLPNFRLAQRYGIQVPANNILVTPVQNNVTITQP